MSCEKERTKILCNKEEDFCFTHFMQFKPELHHFHRPTEDPDGVKGWRVGLGITEEIRLRIPDYRRPAEDDREGFYVECEDLDVAARQCVLCYCVFAEVAFPWHNKPNFMHLHYTQCIEEMDKLGIEYSFKTLAKSEFDANGNQQKTSFWFIADAVTPRRNVRLEYTQEGPGLNVDNYRKAAQFIWEVYFN